MIVAALTVPLLLRGGSWKAEMQPDRLIDDPADRIERRDQVPAVLIHDDESFGGGPVLDEGALRSDIKSAVHALKRPESNLRMRHLIRDHRTTRQHGTT